MFWRGVFLGSFGPQNFFLGGTTWAFILGEGRIFFLNGQWREFRFGEFFILFRRGIFLVWSGHRIFQGPFLEKLWCP